MESETNRTRAFDPLLIGRSAVGGVLMGLANLVPGISGGTMLVASGIYTRFIRAISDVTRLRFRMESLTVLGVVVLSAMVAIALLAGLISELLVSHRWVMYSLFIGLTLGSVPLLVRLASPITRAAWAGAAGGVAVMVALVFVQSAGTAGPATSGWFGLFLAGIAGASAMILPGVSGAYLLLLLGQYQPILESIDRAKDAAQVMDIAAGVAELDVIVPVGVGVVVGVVAVSNVLNLLLRRFPKATLGVLLGLVVAAPVGLYPFKRGVPPEVGERLMGAEVTEENLQDFRAEPKKWREEIYTPTVGRIAASAGLIVLGAGVTLLISRLGNEDQEAPEREEEAVESLSEGAA